MFTASHFALTVIALLVCQALTSECKQLTGDCTSIKDPAACAQHVRFSDEDQQDYEDPEVEALTVQFLQLGMVKERIEEIVHVSEHITRPTLANPTKTHYSLVTAVISRWSWFSVSTAKQIASGGSGALPVLYISLCSVGIALFLLLLGLGCDATSSWRNRARFQSCRNKIQRVVAVTMNHHGDFLLCPCCLELLSSQPSPSIVIFHCGHRLHLECVNRWLGLRPETVVQCPICDRVSVTASSPQGPCNHKYVCDESKTHCVSHDPAEAIPVESIDSESGKDADMADLSVGCYRSLVLESLQRDYPEIVTDTFAKRWISCHPETWFMEVACPTYKPVLKLGKLWTCASKS